MSKAPPTSKSWTLRCKIYTTTVLLYAEASTSIHDLREELLRALREVYPNGMIESEQGPIVIPEVSHDIILGKLIDANNIRSGWERLESSEYASEETRSSKAKGKASAGARLSNGVSNTTVSSAGLKDGSLVGVKFKTDEQESDRDGDPLAEEAWNIILPQREIDEGFDEEIGDAEDLPEVPGGVRSTIERGLHE